MGNRIVKNSTINGNRKYIVDISGGLPVILCEIDSDIADANRSITTKYYYANAQILKQEQLSYGAAEIPGYYENVEVCYEDYQPCILQNWCDPGCCYEQFCHIEHPWVPPVPVEIFVKPFYYVHDRLGSIRLVVNGDGDVNNTYTYNPFGENLTTECSQTTENNFKFTGQWYDDEIGQYYLRARMYDPALMRLTTRDPVKGKPTIPLSVHPYLYCLGDPISDIDPSGEMSAGYLTRGIEAGYEAHYGAIGVTAYGISIGSDAMISLGIAMEQSVGSVMAIAMTSWNGKGWNPVDKMIYDQEQGYKWNCGNGGDPGKVGKWAIVATGLALLASDEDTRDSIISTIDTVFDWIFGNNTDSYSNPPTVGPVP